MVVVAPSTWTRCCVLVLAVSAGSVKLAEHRKRPGKILGATRLVLEIPYMRECADEPDNAIRYSNMTTGMVGKSDFVVNGVFEVFRKATAIESTTIAMTKCRDHVSSNTCEKYSTWRFGKDVCRVMYQSGNNVYTSFLNHVSPRPSCPVKVGTYTVQNATMDTKLLQALPLPFEGNVWIARFEQKEPKGKIHTCTETQMTFHRVRVD